MLLFDLQKDWTLSSRPQEFMFLSHTCLVAYDASPNLAYLVLRNAFSLQNPNIYCKPILCQQSQHSESFMAENVTDWLAFWLAKKIWMYN